MFVLKTSPHPERSISPPASDGIIDLTSDTNTYMENNYPRNSESNCAVSNSDKMPYRPEINTSDKEIYPRMQRDYQQNSGGFTNSECGSDSYRNGSPIWSNTESTSILIKADCAERPAPDDYTARDQSLSWLDREQRIHSKMNQGGRPDLNTNAVRSQDQIGKKFHKINFVERG